jgi:hypothetical protein
MKALKLPGRACSGKVAAILRLFGKDRLGGFCFKLGMGTLLAGG